LHFFSKIDLVKGYHQIPVAAADIPPNMAIITQFSLFEYLCMPFGLSNVAQTFQRMMDCTPDGLEGVFSYMDNSREGSPDRQTHLLHLEAFFKCPGTNGLTIYLEKCVFAVPSLEILGHTISATGSAPTAGHTAEIASCPPPPRHQALATFSRHGEFLLLFFAKLRPLTDLLKGGPKTLKWTATAGRLFRIQSASWSRGYPSNILPHKPIFLLPLSPPKLILAASCSRNLGP
jgi:hypothetical protein